MKSSTNEPLYILRQLMAFVFIALLLFIVLLPPFVWWYLILPWRSGEEWEMNFDDWLYLRMPWLDAFVEWLIDAIEGAMHE